MKPIKCLDVIIAEYPPGKPSKPRKCLRVSRSDASLVRTGWPLALGAKKALTSDGRRQGADIGFITDAQMEEIAPEYEAKQLAQYLIRKIPSAVPSER